MTDSLKALEEQKNQKERNFQKYYKKLREQKKASVDKEMRDAIKDARCKNNLRLEEKGIVKDYTTKKYVSK
ncbi:hypothetical protein IV38_GL001976 [Lactobacillus selangorensis]|uniref:Uncharacterized protein n=1 Tax=Lactobacillus selangorensis TaxID=81857 RepID=A0A0R2FP12_9LACO|nr:hypothetical protein [Lactobacillus selangorensis]KRN27761.1 hypothetical protein IV38_GL001976 [Lactobacillus selangorensis]KRN30274.1 hypothetical protein IV40_GL001861 [Lactobacillus selangorensis]